MGKVTKQSCHIVLKFGPNLGLLSLLHQSNDDNTKNLAKTMSFAPNKTNKSMNQVVMVTERC